MRAHLVGAAGSGMRALAEVLAGRGWRLSGSDLDAAAAERLSPDVAVHVGHAAENLPGHTELVVRSDAVPDENAELRRAAELGVPVLSYFQMLGRLTAGRPTVAVAGTHGKSTVTAMTAAVMVEAGSDPTVFCGAAPLGRSSGGRAGREDFNLVEACEYRANFLNLRPTQAAILGIEPDHFDCYESAAALEAAFSQFAALVPPDGFVLARHDCPAARRATKGLSCRVETFGFSPEADWSAVLPPQPGGGAAKFRLRGEPFCALTLQTPGRHNVLNALAAAALAWHNSASPTQVAAALERFRGLSRRLELRGRRRGVWLVDDYAHHPTEVTAALETVRELFPRRRIWCIFQPHQTSRTARLLEELAANLQTADKVLVAEIFRAREGPPRAGDVTAADLACAINGKGGGSPPKAFVGVHGREQIIHTLETNLMPGDVAVTMGAGDIRGIGDELFQRL